MKISELIRAFEKLPRSLTFSQGIKDPVVLSGRGIGFTQTREPMTAGEILSRLTSLIGIALDPRTLIQGHTMLLWSFTWEEISMSDFHIDWDLLVAGPGFNDPPRPCNAVLAARLRGRADVLSSRFGTCELLYEAADALDPLTT